VLATAQPLWTVGQCRNAVVGLFSATEEARVLVLLVKALQSVEARRLMAWVRENRRLSVESAAGLFLFEAEMDEEAGSFESAHRCFFLAASKLQAVSDAALPHPLLLRTLEGYCRTALRLEQDPCLPHLIEASEQFVAAATHLGLASIAEGTLGVSDSEKFPYALLIHRNALLCSGKAPIAYPDRKSVSSSSVGDSFDVRTLLNFSLHTVFDDALGPPSGALLLMQAPLRRQPGLRRWMWPLRVCFCMTARVRVHRSPCLPRSQCGSCAAVRPAPQTPAAQTTTACLSLLVPVAMASAGTWQVIWDWATPEPAWFQRSYPSSTTLAAWPAPVRSRRILTPWPCAVRVSIAGRCSSSSLELQRLAGAFVEMWMEVWSLFLLLRW
jgi:hypothetical protein